jgi:7,8-dihydropterin-6-yl-methyl-4-(beta-D-ribofuranosyl)aminobenzene 5'-phosphate synthase
MKITIIYDNTVWQRGLEADWGFSCLVEAHTRTLLFDTGAKGSLLLDNMRKLQIDPTSIDAVFISHDHWDHMGGLSDFLDIHPVRVFVPSSYAHPLKAEEVISVTKGTEIYDGIFSTGELRNGEHSLCIRKNGDVVIVAGCSHPGVADILKASSVYGKPVALIGGLHGFSDYGAIESLTLICPGHCTQHKAEIQARYPDAYMESGAGRVIEL